MCGSIKIENLAKRVFIGGYIDKNHLNGSPEHPDKYRWSSWARIDGSKDKNKSFVETWKSKKWRIVTIKTTEFTERDKNKKEVIFKTNNKQLAAIVNKEGELRILTRPARGKELSVHNRQPIQVSNKMNLDGFTKYVNKKLGADYK